MPKPTIWVVDTSILLNILEFPGRCQDREAVLTDFASYIANGDSFVLPITSIIETGNWMYKLEKGLRKQQAEKFVKLVTDALEGNAPWRVLHFPGQPKMLEYLKHLPQHVEQMGLGDLIILKQWEELCSDLPQYTAKIWSLDKNALKGRECNH